MKEEQDIKQLPKDWKWVKLKDISENIQYGYTESSSKEIVGPKFLRITDIQENKVIWDEVPYCKIDDNNKKKYLLKDGDLVFARTGATVGKSYLLKGKIPESVFASYLIRVRVNKEINEQYLSNFFHSTIYWSQITEGQVGIGQPNVNGTKLGQLNLPLPPKPTQLAIVSKIEELFSELDKGIEQLKAAQQQLKTYRQSVLKWAFEGKLTEEWRTAVRIRSAPHELSMAAEQEVAYGKESDLPEGWKWKSLKEITSILGDGLHGTPNYTENGDYYFINGNNLSDGKIVFKASTKRVGFEVYQKHKKLLNETTILVSINGTLGNSAFYNGEKVILGKSACYFNLNNEADKYYIRYVLTSQRFLNYAIDTATGSTIPNVSLKAMREFEIPLPPIDEQHKIVQEIESRFSVADRMEESITQSLQQAEALRQSILKKAFEGRLVNNEVAEIKVSKVVTPHERKVLAGKIIHLMHDGHHFGLTKFQKVLYLVENFSQIDYDTNYIQERAGPYDKNFTVAFRREMLEKNWFGEAQKNIITKFVPGENVGSLIVDYAKYFRSVGPKISFVIQQLMDKSTHDAELIATLYAVWNNRLIKKKPVAVKYLVEDFFNWSEKKKNEFQEEEVVVMYKWMKKVKLAPVGFGKVIEPSNS